MAIRPVQSKKLETKFLKYSPHLDLDTIWQQTVDSLGEALGVSHCIICPYKPGSLQVQVVAEYTSESVQSMLGLELPIANDPAFCQALKRLEPIVVEQTEHPHFQQQSLLVVTTSRPTECLISLHQCVRVSASVAGGGQIRRLASGQQLKLNWYGELADQVGTAIAHATLYKSWNSHANKQKNPRLKSEFLANTSTNSAPSQRYARFLKLILEAWQMIRGAAGIYQEAYRSALHLLNIINDILDIAKIKRAKWS